MPDKLALIVDGNFNVIFPLPLTETAELVLEPSESAMYIFQAVPQLAVVILAEPLNEVPLIVLAVAKVSAWISYEILFTCICLMFAIIYPFYYLLNSIFCNSSSRTSAQVSSSNSYHPAYGSRSSNLLAIQVSINSEISSGRR